MKPHPHRHLSSSMPWPWLGAAWLFLMLAGPVLAVDPIWPPADQSGAVFNYTVPGNPPPTIDATAFDNENEFTINFSASTRNPEIYETEDTLFYTNNGLMVANSPLGVNGIFLSFAPGCGFLFDDQNTMTGFHVPAGTFYNPGQIHANSLLDVGTNAFILSTVGKISILATNIFNSGDVVVGEDGLIAVTGQNVDLTGANLTVEGITSVFNLLGIFETGLLFNQNVAGLDYGVGTDTNLDWDPSIDLTNNSATSSFFNSFLFPAPAENQMRVLPSTPYFETDELLTNYFLTRAVYISTNPNPNVTESIYFGGNPTPNLGPGFVTIQFTGSYTDPTTGLPANNYLYLNDLYIRGANTNNPVFNGVPANFTFTELSTPANFTTTPATPNFPNYPPGVVTNNYSYVLAQFLASNAATNGLALTNLPGRVQISASHDLNLAQTTVTGPNYLSLTATNEFKGSVGASIFSLYTDANLGVTNGYLSVSNLLAPNLPAWSGTVQAWSSDWFNVDSNGNTNEYRVLLVNPNLTPTTASVVQNLTLHSTNTVISDIFNIIGQLYIDATSLTLTTNLATSGFGSPDGELNWISGATTLNTVQLPNLRWLTNSGAIRVKNLAVFGSSGAPYGAFINNTLLVDSGTTLWVTNFLNGGAISNGTGSFLLQSRTTTMTNGTVTAGGDVQITGTSLVFSNESLSAGRMLSLTATNLLTDLGATNTSFWSVGLAGTGSINDSGFNLPIKPLTGDLLGTTVTNYAPPTKNIPNLWAALDRGYSNAGFLNNAAVGQLVLDIQSSGAKFTFNGTGTNGVTNAIYVDCLQLHHYASYTNRNTSTNIIPTLVFNTNLVIYYAQALTDDGISIAEKINHFNGDHLRWVPTYAGNFSSVTLVYPDGTTNTVNAALAASSDDSDGDGIPNNAPDPSPIFTPSQLVFTGIVTNVPPKSVRLTWRTVANGTNYVFYATNLLSPTWKPFTNFQSFYYDPNKSGIKNGSNWFASPMPYPSPPTNVWIYDTITNVPHFYQVTVQPWLTYPN